MTDAAYRLAIDSAVIGRAMRAAAAMAYYFRSRAVHVAGRTGAVATRMQALGRLNSGPGGGALLGALHRFVAHRGGRQVIAAGGRGSFMPRATPDISRRSPILRSNLPKTGIMSAALRRKAFTARADGTAPGAKAIGAEGVPFAEQCLRSVVLARTVARGLTRRIADARRLAGPGEPRLATRTLALGEALHRAPSLMAPGSVQRWHPIAGPVPQQGAAPGFQRTVRQAATTAPAGNVFLDKNLVGYHLAAAITAEQTRAAGRPNISGSSFNSSMAALRPSGAGS